MLMKKLAVTMLAILPLSAMADVTVREVVGIPLGVSLSEAQQLLKNHADDDPLLRDNRVTAQKTSRNRMSVTALPTDGDTAVNISRHVEYWVFQEGGLATQLTYKARSMLTLVSMVNQANKLM